MTEEIAIHDFQKKLKEGKDSENLLDAVFARWYEIRKVSKKQEINTGIDRIFTCRETEIKFTVEYKADSQAAETGNAFIETVSVDNTGAPGWALKSLAQVLIYFIPSTRLAYILSMFSVKYYLVQWAKDHNLAPAYNNNYVTYGFPVPLSKIHAVALDVVDVRFDGFFDRLKRQAAFRPAMVPARKIGDILKSADGSLLGEKNAAVIEAARENGRNHG